MSESPEDDTHEPGPDPASAKRDGPSHEMPSPALDEPGPAEQRQSEQLDAVRTSLVFNGPVYASGSTFGTAQGLVGATTGTMDEVAMSMASMVFVEPALYRVAKTALQESRVIILTGEDGCGKATAALRLLSAQSRRTVEGLAEVGSPIVGLSPLVEWRALAEYKFKPNHAYVVIDYSPPRARQADIAHQLRRLFKQIADVSDCRLVITTTRDIPTSHTDVPALRWVPPSASELVEGFELDKKLTPSQLTAVKRLVTETGNPLKYASALRQLALTPDQADRLLKETATEQLQVVRDWFATERTRREVAAVTTLAFFTGASIQEAERLLLNLEKRLAESTNATTKATKSHEMPRLRNDLFNLPFFSASSGSASPSSRGNTAGFQQADQRTEVLRELWRQYSFQLWGPVRAWLDTVVKELDITDRHDLENHARFTSGLAIMAQFAFDDVLHEWLNPWARGNTDSVVAAATVLTQVHGNLGARALATAIGWATDDDPTRALTGVLALSGQLGLRFPAQALNEIWRFGGQGPGQRLFANAAVASLFALGVELESRPLAAIRFSIRRIELSREQRAPDAASQRTRAYLLALALLTANLDQSERCAMATILLSGIDKAREVARLCWLLFANARFRARAIDALHEVLEDVAASDTNSSSLHIFAEVLREGRRQSEVQRLRKDFYTVFSTRRLRDVRAQQPRRDYSSFLDALRENDA